MATLNIRLDDELKAQSFAVIERFGMTPSQAIKLFLTQIANTDTIPLSFDYKKNEPAIFDIDRMKQAIQGVETEELALKNGLHLPQGKTPAELLEWLKTNIPTHLDKGH